MGELLKDRYWLQEALGEGAMGTVYRAVDVRTKGTVAVKVLHSRMSDSSRQLRELWREMRAVARMNHDNIVQVVDYGQFDDRTPFFVMEHIPGRSLDLWRGQLSGLDLLNLTDGILAALGYAHARGVIHRDLKPENILVVEAADGILRPKLVDFGVAHVGGLHIDATTSQLGSNIIVGTPAYMSPEQALGLAPTTGPESDLYSLGILLYEFVAGHLPFDADNAFGIMLKHTNEKPASLYPMRGLELPEGFCPLVHTLLNKSPLDRPLFAADARRYIRHLDWTQASEEPPAALDTQDLEELAQEQIFASTLGLSEDQATGNPPNEDLLRTIFETRDGQVESSGAANLLKLREVPLVARDQEKALLWHRVESTLNSRQAEFVLLEGVEGSGKSVILRWLAQRVEEEGLMQAMGGGVGPGALFPAGGLRGFIERYLRIQDLDKKAATEIVRQRLIDTGHFESQELAPLMSLLRPEAATEAAVKVADHIPLTARIVRAAADRRPVLLLFDDLHGPDALLALDLIDLILATRSFSPFPVLMVATRTLASEDRFDDEIRDRIATLSPRAALQSHQVAPMQPHETRALVNAILPAGEALLDLVLSRSKGLPAYAIQLLRHWYDAGELVDNGFGQYVLRNQTERIQRVPRDLIEIMSSRLGAVISESSDSVLARQLIGRAAIVASTIPLSLLEDLLQQEQLMSGLALDELSQRLLDEGIWLEVEPGLVRFSNEAMRLRAAEHLLKASDRVRTHSLVAELMRRYYSEDIERHLGAIGRHLLAAGDYQRGVETLINAGKHALHLANFSRAQLDFEAVIQVIDKHHINGASHLADEANLGLAKVGVETGAYGAAMLQLEAIQQRGRPNARKEALADATFIHAQVTHKRGDLELATQLFQQANDRFSDVGQLHGVARSLRGLAEVFASRRMYERLRAIASTAQKLFKSLNDPVELAHCLRLQGQAARLEGRLNEAKDLYDAANQIFVDVGAKQHSLRVQIWLGDALLASRRFAEAIELFESISASLSQIGDRASLITCARALCRAHRELSQLEAAEAAALQGVAVATEIGDDLSRARLLNDLGLLAREHELFDQAKNYFQDSIDACIDCGALSSAAMGHANQGLLYLKQASWHQAIVAFERAVALAEQVGEKRMQGAYLGNLSQSYAEIADWEGTSRSLKRALDLDALTPIVEADFLKALDRLAELAQDAGQIELAEMALSLTAQRWPSAGDEARATQAAERLKSVRKYMSCCGV